MEDKIKVKVAGVGSVDLCDHCGTEFTKGVACWATSEWESLNICNKCFDKYYEDDSFELSDKLSDDL